MIIIFHQSSSDLLLAHDEEFRTVEVVLNVPAVPSSFLDKEGKDVTLNKAYLSSFSIQLISCDSLKASAKTNIVMNVIDWLVPPVYANHSIKLNAPGQMSIKVMHQLLKGSTLAVGKFKIAVGRYCAINYTMGHTSKKSVTEFSQQFSLLLEIQNNTEQSENEQRLSASYAYGKDIPIDLLITAWDKTQRQELKLNLTLDAGAALKNISFEQLEHKVVRDLIFEIPKHLSVVITD